LPTEESARIALRTQQIIASETGVANTVDPVAGSYAIETATNAIEQGARELIERIDRAGGTLTAIETGFIQREIQESAYQAQRAVDSGDAVVVGVNRFNDRAERGTGMAELLRIDPDVERRQIARVQALRAERDGANLVPPIVAAVEARATVGEIADTMRAVFGEFTETATL